MNVFLNEKRIAVLKVGLSIGWTVVKHQNLGNEKIKQDHFLLMCA